MVLSRFVGAEVRRKEDPRLITGSSTYVDDVRMAGLSYLTLVRSPHPHARILGIDASAAVAMPGVIAVITGDELACANAATAAAVTEVVLGQTICESPWSGGTLFS